LNFELLIIMENTKIKPIIDAVEALSVVELNALVKALEEKFGVSAAPTLSVGAPAAGSGATAEEKSAFTIELTDGGANKIAVIKVVKEALGMGLKDAKDLVDAAPKVLKENVKKEDAEKIKKDIEAAGGKVALK
jgi:large subunit ribosomal protein L7/L12